MVDNENVRMSISIPSDLADCVYKLRQTDKYRRCSISEILRLLIAVGLNAKGYPVDIKED